MCFAFTCHGGKPFRALAFKLMSQWAERARKSAVSMQGDQPSSSAEEWRFTAHPSEEESARQSEVKGVLGRGNKQKHMQARRPPLNYSELIMCHCAKLFIIRHLSLSSQ